MADYSEQKRTLDDVLLKLKESHKCAILRPTGFGKTYLMTDLISRYKHVLYLYPSAVIRDTVVNRYYDNIRDDISKDYADEDNDIIDPETIETYRQLKNIKNCTLMTYHKLIRISDKEFEKMSYDLIIFDEMHRLGGPRTKIATEKLFAKNPDSNFVGATATPTRMDNFDPVAVFFNNIMCYPYTLHDAITAGMIQKPNYYYCTTDIHHDLINEAIKNDCNLNDTDISEMIDAKTIEGARLFNMPTIIKTACSKYAVKKDYFKFIVFFSTKHNMDTKLPDVISWFKDAYPAYAINTLRISSFSAKEIKNTEKLQDLEPLKKHIDIIACIDMLNVGYHVNNLTGIIMYRGTRSSTVFIQQLGRALSAGSDNSAIVIDVVDNLHRRAVYDMKCTLTDKKLRHSKTKSINTKLSKYFLADDKLSVMTMDVDGKPIKTQYHLDKNNQIVDAQNVISAFQYNVDDKMIYENIDTSNKNVNNCVITDFNMTGHEASYREFLAKALAEPLTQRCKYALEIHFRSWCLNHHVPYPISDADLVNLYKLDKNDFYKEFCKIIQLNKIDYPLQDAKQLMQLGTTKNSIDVPLAICAKARHISIEQILDLLLPKTA